MKNISLRFTLFALTFVVGVLFSAFLVFQNSAADKVVNHPIPKNVAAKGEFADVFYALRTDIVGKRNVTINQIHSFADNDAGNRNQIVGAMIGETAKLCSTKYFDGADFDEMEIIAGILADWQATEALDALIYCSDKRTSVGGLSYFNYPTMPAIIKYEQSAIPTLERKLNDPDTPKEIKTHIISLLIMIGGSQIRGIMIEALKYQTDEETVEYLNRVIKDFNEVADIDKRIE